MKNRTGFVSNSSSTSFCVVATANKYREFMDTLDSIQIRFLENYFYKKEQNLNGIPCVVLLGTICSEERMFSESELNNFGYDCEYEVWEKIVFPESFIVYSENE